jgi:immune inhibitor A
VNGTATLPAGTTHIAFRYWTDGAVVGKGFAVDSIVVGGLTDTAEDPAPWTFAGFSRVTNGEITNSFFHYYLVESRNYLRNDESLRGTYQFLKGDWLEKQPYADGVLIWYPNSGVPNNDVSLHPGEGQILVVDSHPAPNVSPDGRGYLRERWQTWDSTFGFKSHQITLHEYQGNVLRERTYNAPAVSTFFDSNPTAYYDSRIPYNSVKTAGSGLKITLLSVSADGTTYLVRVHR